jgi:tetratricopeptide (TPR) repeat protein
MLPPVCRLILVEKPSAHQEQTQNAALLERPEYRMAKGNIHLHHYCYGLVNRNRYFSSKAKLERDRWLIETIAEFEYVLVNSEKEWPYFHQLYFEEAEMYYFAGDLPRALLKAKNSLAHSPGFEKAHALISDIYRKQGNKDQAIQQLHAGLSAEPTSKGLLRRLKDLNPGDPYLKSPRVASEKASPALGAPADEKQTKPTADDIVGETRDVDSTPTSVSKEAPSAAADSVRKGTHTPATPGNADQNPYCRFCP